MIICKLVVYRWGVQGRQKEESAQLSQGQEYQLGQQGRHLYSPGLPFGVFFDSLYYFVENLTSR